VIGEITKSVDFCTRQPTAVSQIRQAVLDFQELGTRHREIAAEFFVTEPAESFGDQTRRRAGRISKLIAKFEILSDYGVATIATMRSLSSAASCHARSSEKVATITLPHEHPACQRRAAPWHRRTVAP